MKHLLLFFLFCLSLAACRNKDPFTCIDENEGEVSLFDTTFFFLGDFDKNSLVVYRNTLGDTLHLLCDTQIIDTKINIEKRCENIDLSTHYYYLDGMKHKLIIGKNDIGQNERLSFEIMASVINPVLIDRQDYTLCDVFSALVFDNIAITGQEMSGYFAAPADQPKIIEAGISNKFRFVSDTTFLGKSFSNLYESTAVYDAAPSQLVFYVSAGLGVVAFRTHTGEFWVQETIIY